jgi:hypothetical protein
MTDSKKPQTKGGLTRRSVRGWEASEPVLLPWVSATTMRTSMRRSSIPISGRRATKSRMVAQAEDSVYFKASYSSESERLAADAPLPKKLRRKASSSSRMMARFRWQKAGSRFSV